MKKPIVMLLVFVLISAISMAMISPARAAFNLGDWRPPYVSKDSIVIYEDGTTASSIVGLSNDVHPVITMNVSKIIFEFYQIGKNKTLDLSANPYQLQHDQQGIFTVSFTADGTEFYSGIQFDYNLIIEWVNATTGPKKVVGSWEYPRWWTGMPAFEVYPVARVDADDSVEKYYSYYDYYWWYSWQSILAQQKSTQAVIEKDLGDTYYDRGDYASALTKYDLANTLWEEALAAEKDWRSKDETADLNQSLTLSEAQLTTAKASMKEADAAVIEANAAMMTANATKIQADAALVNAYGWYFIGIGFAIGWTLMGIGVIIYSWRRPKPPV